MEGKLGEAPVREEKAEGKAAEGAGPAGGGGDEITDATLLLTRFLVAVETKDLAKALALSEAST
jgi:hypothetical protein